MRTTDIEIDVTVYRSNIDGKIVIDIDTQNLTGADVYGNGVPRLTLRINDDTEDLTPNGKWSNN